MNIADLPLPLRLRNALLRAGFQTDENLHHWFRFADVGTTIPGVGATGMKQLTDWHVGAVADDDALKGDGAGTIKSLLEPETPEEAVARGLKRHEVTQVLDSAMRGGLETLDARRSEDMVAALHRRQFDAALEREHMRSLSLQGTASFGDMTAMFKASGGRVDVRSGQNARKLLALDLESEIQARISALIPTIKELPHVKELGVEVSAETVGRMALIRGLDALERAHGGAKKAENAKNEAKTTQNDDLPDDIPHPDPDADVMDTPEGWTRVGATEKIPVPEAVLHDYYTQNGWNRYWGRAGDQVIHFYWSPERRLQALDPFPGTDKSGRKVAVQETPWGPGHVVPVKWANS